MTTPEMLGLIAVVLYLGFWSIESKLTRIAKALESKK